MKNLIYSTCVMMTLSQVSPAAAMEDANEQFRPLPEVASYITGKGSSNGWLPDWKYCSTDPEYQDIDCQKPTNGAGEFAVRIGKIVDYARTIRDYSTEDPEFLKHFDTSVLNNLLQYVDATPHWRKNKRTISEVLAKLQYGDVWQLLFRMTESDIISELSLPAPIVLSDGTKTSATENKTPEDNKGLEKGEGSHDTPRPKPLGPTHHVLPILRQCLETRANGSQLTPEQSSALADLAEKLKTIANYACTIVCGCDKYDRYDGQFLSHSGIKALQILKDHTRSGNWQTSPYGIEEVVELINIPNQVEKFGFVMA
ncbi:hypothetical protein FACS189472_03540 [Alphaproteobacteria bacterium]|nr:hypothetical protein FACS189472_03540 [Alphaproteobacteria bacterium]